MNRVNILLFLLLLAIVLAAPVVAQISPHFDLGWSLFSGGGGSRSSVQYQIDDVLGQWPDKRSSSAHYQIDPGFWHAGRVIEARRLYMPAAFKSAS